MEYEGFLELVRERRSTRAFTGNPVSDEAVDRIIETARWAPSGTNSQPWEFVVVRDAETKHRIAGFVKAQGQAFHDVEMTRPVEMRWPSAARSVSDPGWKDAPVLILACGDRRTMKSYPLYAQLSRGESIFCASMTNAFMYMALAATSLGLGYQWITGVSFPSVMPLIMEALGIPDDFFVHDMMAIGHPAAQRRPRVVRTLEEIIHRGRYDQAKRRTDSQVTDFLVSLRK